jgi:hypothetical protein
MVPERAFAIVIAIFTVGDLAGALMTTVSADPTEWETIYDEDVPIARGDHWSFLFGDEEAVFVELDGIDGAVFDAYIMEPDEFDAYLDGEEFEPYEGEAAEGVGQATLGDPANGLPEPFGLYLVIDNSDAGAAGSEGEILLRIIIRSEDCGCPDNVIGDMTGEDRTLFLVISGGIVAAVVATVVTLVWYRRRGGGDGTGGDADEGRDGTDPGTPGLRY